MIKIYSIKIITSFASFTVLKSIDLEWKTQLTATISHSGRLGEKSAGFFIILLVFLDWFSNYYILQPICKMFFPLAKSVIIGKCNFNIFFSNDFVDSYVLFFPKKKYYLNTAIDGLKLRYTFKRVCWNER